MLKALVPTLILGVVPLIAPLAAADPTSAPGANQADPREQELQDLKARQEKLEHEIAGEKVKAEDGRIESGSRLAKVEQAHDAVQWTINDGRPVVRSGDGRFEFALRATMQLDWAHYKLDDSDFGLGYGPANSCALTNPLCDLGDGAVFRRVRFGSEGRFYRDFIYELRFEFGGSDVEGNGVINIARIGYIGIPGLRVHAGALEPIMTLAASTSSNELATMERASVVSTVTGPFGAEDSRRGIEATYQHENLLWDGDNFMISGAFTGNKTSGLGGCAAAGHSGGNSVDDECTQIFGRTTYRLWSDGTSNVQVGTTGGQILSLQGREAGGDRTVQFRERPEVRVSGDRFVDTGAIPATGGSLFGLEAGMNWENIYLAGEWFQWSVDRDNSTLLTAGADPEFSGWYIEGEWILTGENKRYAAAALNNNVAVWRGPTVSSPWGAWSLSGRYSTMDLDFEAGTPGAACLEFAQCIRGGQQSIVNAGLNWQVNANLKFMTELAMVDIDRLNYAGQTLNTEFEIIQGRMQFGF